MDIVWILLILVGSLVLVATAAFFWMRANQPAPPPSPSPTPPLTPPTEPEGPPLDESTNWRVLVIDDIPVWGDTIRKYSAALPCEVRHLTNFNLAIRELARWRPHLILLDWHMPRDNWQPIPEIRKKYRPTEMSLAFCEQVSSHPRLKDIKIIFTSVEKQEEAKAAAFAAGAHAYYTKESFSYDSLRHLLLDLQAAHAEISPA